MFNPVSKISKAYLYSSKIIFFCPELTLIDVRIPLVSNMLFDLSGHGILFI
jgi:hypothetical protein